ncbi:hypothetical protein TVAG_245510 [Trichomonas vaginalis G3]|uniref:Uncharacterized protein n=1 Tax=Trichomonas vaginalis (strain ATCC PRA-98 / G3) TaxID=412133 RepID=A2GE03_TRIV3|nr:hypothetical protein TVAG_245510 [Trichomonas vaginalis G3]|eukprot:XP_001297543.1 hypothetical protein [Trichomonas vaginalis G3]
MSLIFFLICNRFDEEGVEFSDDYSRLTRAPAGLSADFVIPTSVVDISGGTNQLSSPFKECRSKLKSIRFDVSSGGQTRPLSLFH